MTKSNKPKAEFMLVNAAAQRARQLMQGAAPLIRTQSRKPAAIAIREVYEGLIPLYLPGELPLSSEIEASAEEEEEEVEKESD